MAPDIDIIIPCLNCGPFLTQALQSVWDQQGDFTIHQVLVVNDRSDDPQTSALLDELRQSDRIRVLDNAGPKGAAAARNTGLRASSAEWVIFLDGDDLLTHDSIQQRIEVLSTHPGIGWIGGDITVIDVDGKPEEESFFRSRARPREFLRAAWSADQAVKFPKPVSMFINVCVSQVGAGMIRRELIERVGGFREDLLQAEDYQLWIRLAAITDFAFLPRTLLLYRQHGASTMASDIPPRFWTIKAFKQLRVEPMFTQYRKLINGRISHFYLENAHYFVRKEQLGSAVKAYLHSFLKAPNLRAPLGLLGLLARPFRKR